MNCLLLGVLYSFANSIYSLMLTFTGILGKWIISAIAISIMITSVRGNRSTSQLRVFLEISCFSSEARLTVASKSFFIKSLSIANVPAKVWLANDGDALLVTAAAYADDLTARLR